MELPEKPLSLEFSPLEIYKHDNRYKYLFNIVLDKKQVPQCVRKGI